MTEIGAPRSDRVPAGDKKTAERKVFEAARDLFYRRGVRAVSVDEIVCSAGVTKPSLYRAFKSKDDLIAACLREGAREDYESLLTSVSAAGADPRQKLDAIISHFAGKIGQPDFRGCPISNVAVELPEPAHPGRQIIEQSKIDLRSMIVDCARALHIKNPEGLADGLLLTIEGAFATHHIFGSQGPSKALTDTCSALIDAHSRV